MLVLGDCALPERLRVSVCALRECVADTVGRRLPVRVRETVCDSVGGWLRECVGDARERDDDTVLAVEDRVRVAARVFVGVADACDGDGVPVEVCVGGWLRVCERVSRD
uniref:Uncharacterized protein n=1 Tax=Neobodo designis TaxID=312471 RepID=A0A7S1MS61_NEODS